MTPSLVWIYFFILLTLAMFLLVPGRRIRELLPFGIGGGFIVALIVQYLGVEVFKLWRFSAAFAAWGNIPVGILLSWVPPTIIFGYLFYKVENRLGLIIFFAFFTTVIEYGFLKAGYREYFNWSIYWTFLLALVIHLGLASYLTYGVDINAGNRKND